jgi:hypothetical protein
MKKWFHNLIYYVGNAIKFIGIGMIIGISLAEFRYVYLIIMILILIGLCLEMFFRPKLQNENRN